jgi:hypothetical protein
MIIMKFPSYVSIGNGTYLDVGITSLNSRFKVRKISAVEIKEIKVLGAYLNQSTKESKIV